MSEPPRVLVTAGPTREPIDPIRYLSNGASGALGIELARQLRAAGFAVELALGPTHLAPPDSVTTHRIETAHDLDRVCRERWPDVDAFVATAAVCDYRPADVSDTKIKKRPGDWNLQLVRNPDVLLERSKEKGARVLVGFALESPVDFAKAEEKRVAKGLDAIILNSPRQLGSSTKGLAGRSSEDVSLDVSLGSDPTGSDPAASDAVHWLDGDSAPRPLPPAKPKICEEIVRFLASRLLSV